MDPPYSWALPLLHLRDWYFLLVSLGKERSLPVSDKPAMCFLSVTISLHPRGLGRGWVRLHPSGEDKYGSSS